MKARTFLRQERGSMLVEFAFTLVLLLMLLFGIVDIGRALYTASSLNSAAREGARFGAARVPPNTPVANDAAVRARVVSSFTPFGGPPIQNNQVTVTPVMSGGNLQAIQVRIDYPFTWITPLAALVGTLKDTLHAQARYKWEAAP